MVKKNLVIFFGGRSVEHDVSIITGAQAVQNADPNTYNIIPVYLAHDGKFFYIEKTDEIKEFIKNISAKKTPVDIDIADRTICFKKSRLPGFGKKVEKIDIAFPAFHGTFGEDGSFQGLLEIANVPYVGSGVEASAIGMNKILFKTVMLHHRVPVLPWQEVTEGHLKNNSLPRRDFPCIVKPVNLGSSIGVKKVSNENELKEALEVALRLDSKALIEPFLENMIEINCSVLGTADENEASVCEQPLSAKEVLSFEDKYISGNKSKKIQSQGMANLDRRIPAPIPKEQAQAIQKLAQQVFHCCKCSGVARIDFMIDKNNQTIYANEINTIPGSLSFYLWEASGKSFRELINGLVNIALKEHAKKNSLLRTFHSPILEKFK